MYLSLPAVWKRLALLWQPLPLAARLCLLTWIALGSLGVVRFAKEIPSAIQGARLGDLGQRQALWAPTYGFAAACAARVAPGTSILLVDPTDPAWFFDRRPYDQVNLGVFAYILYPHQVIPLGVVPANWTPAATTVDYVAVWEQTMNRSQSSQAAAHAVERKLQQAPSPQLVCTYTGPQNAHGALYAVSTRAQSALAVTRAAPASGTPLASAHPSSALETVDTYLLALAGLVSLWLIGLLVLLAFPRGTLRPLLMAALALPLGCLVVAFELLLTALLGIAWSPAALGLPWLALAAFVLWSRRALLTSAHGWSLRMGVRAVLQRPTRWRLALDERFALGTLVAIGLITLIAAPSELPVLDGFGFYYFKAAAFFHDRGIVPYYQHAGLRAFTAPAHPPLVSLCVTWLYLWIGRVSEHATFFLWPAFFISLLAGFYALARSVVSRRLALWATVGLALVGFPDHILGGTFPWQKYDILAVASLVVGWADLPLAVFLLAGCGLLWRWAASGRKSSSLVLAGLFLGGAALTKEEGLTAACVAIAASPLLVVWGRRGARGQPRGRWWWPLAWSVPGFALSVVPLLLLRARYPLPDFRFSLSPTVLLQNLVISAMGFGVWMVALWLAPLVLIATWVLQQRHRGAPLAPALTGRLLLLGCVVLGQAAIDVATIASISAPVELPGELHTAGSRLLMQLLPLVFLGTVALWPDVLARHNAPPAPDATEQDAAPAAQLVAGLPV